MKNLLLLIISILGGITAGCGREASTAPQPQRSSWTLLSIHFDGDGSVDSQVDLAISSSAEVTLHHGWGNEVSSRGLLAGGKLETLTRLVDALPPHSYAATTPCNPGGYVVRLVRDGVERTYQSGACDPAAPASVVALADHFTAMVDEVLSPPARAVITTTLLVGTDSAIEGPRRLILRDRDALARLLRELSPDQPAAVARVDFSRRMVVAEFLGPRPTSGYEVESEGAVITQGGLMRIGFGARVPGEGCRTTDGLTHPFVLVAVEARPDADLLFETTTVEVHCE